jgi:hypothetical protein
MNENQLLMQVSDIQNLTAISEQVSPELLQPFIFNAQTLYLRPVLGLPLYEDMQNDLATGGTKYQALLEGWVYYSLAYWTFYNYLPFGHLKIQKKGVVKQHSDDSENASIDELGMLLKRVESMATTYTQVLIEYLNGSGGSLYPLYTRDVESEYKPKGHSIYIKRRVNDGITSYNPRNGYYI